MIPEFPEFKNLELSDREEIENMTHQFQPYSDFHFITIFCWDIDNTTQISKLNENLIIKQIDCLTCEQFFSFIGINEVSQTINQISNFLKENDLPLIFRWMPEVTVNCLNGTHAVITEDRDYFDYIYSVDDFYNATGSKKKKYRKCVNVFKKRYSNIVTTQIDITNNEVKKQIDLLFISWSKKKDIRDDNCEFSYEHKALDKLLSSANNFNMLVALGLYDNNELIAFAIEDLSDKIYGSSLFWKANTNYKGIYPYLQKEITNLYRNREIKFMNWESDLGLMSLRASKLSYNPSFFLKKYMIEICNNNQNL